MAEIIRLDRVRKWEGEGTARVDILKGVSLSIQKGEFVAIMGPSGSGKSTLLNLIGLLDTPSAGAVLLEGQDVSTLGEDDLAERRSRAVGFIFQQFHLLPNLTVRQNVRLPLTYDRGPRPRDRSEELLAKVGLQHRMDSFPATLSGGERQRAAIARSLMNEPKLLLADEPTGALDSATGAQILQVIADLHHSGATVVLITHDESVARRAERVLRLRDGQLS